MSQDRSHDADAPDLITRLRDDLARVQRELDIAVKALKQICMTPLSAQAGDRPQAKAAQALARIRRDETSDD